MTIAMIAAHNNVFTISQNSPKAPEGLRDIRSSLLHGSRRRRPLAQSRGIKPAGATKVKEVGHPVRQSFHASFQALGRFQAGLAEMMTMAWACGKSSVMVRSIWAAMPGGVIACSRLSAPPVSLKVGLPDGRLTTPMSRQNTPARRPVPRALAHASLAAKRLA